MIEAEKASCPIKRTYELLEVSRSGYYKWRTSRDRGPTPAQRRRTELDAKAAEFHAASDGVYRAPRILADRGCQYTSMELAWFAIEHNLVRSVGRTGVCWDNAQAESLWATLKVEFYDRYLWPTKALAKLAVGDWIEGVYNRRRRHSALGMISPVEFENRLTQTAQAAGRCVSPNGCYAHRNRSHMQPDERSVMKETTLRVPAGVGAGDMDVQGIRTRVFEVDPANALTPLILLHGAGLDSALVSFGSALVSLGRRRRVIAPDLPGYGETEFSDSPFSIPWYGDWVADLIDRLGLDRVDLAGLSLGGWITLEVAISHPDVVHRIAPINPGGVTEKFKFIRTAEWVANHPAMNRQMYRWYARMGRRFTRMQLRSRIIENATALTDDLIDAVLVNSERPHAGEAFAATQRWAFSVGPQSWSLVSRLPQIRAKTLIIAGRNDKLVPVADSIRASQLVQDGDVRILEPCGHWLVRDCPTEFVDAVNQFLDAV